MVRRISEDHEWRTCLPCFEWLEKKRREKGEVTGRGNKPELFNFPEFVKYVVNAKGSFLIAIHDLTSLLTFLTSFFSSSSHALLEMFI